MKENENNILVAKERLKFSSINYKKLVSEKDFYQSLFFEKNRNLLIVFYKYEKINLQTIKNYCKWSW